MAPNRNMMAKFDPRLLYGNIRTTLMHSLEAFTEKPIIRSPTYHLTDGLFDDIIIGYRSMLYH